MILPIPTTTTNDFGPTIYKLIQLSEIVNRSKDEKIIINFNNTRFLHCNYLSGLFSMINNWKMLGKEIELIYNNSPISSYLDTIHFGSGFNAGDCVDIAETLEHYKSKSYTPLLVFPTVGMYRESCINSIIDLVERQSNVKGAFRGAIEHFITELTNNVADHSESSFGLIAAQTYKEHIDISISDNGIGVLASYNKSDKFHPNSEAEAIEMAVNGKSTKVQAISRGFGLTSSREIIINELDGRFLMWSGGVIFIQTDKTPNILQLSNGAFYNGCFVSLRLARNGNDSFNLYDYMEK